MDRRDRRCFFIVFCITAALAEPPADPRTAAIANLRSLGQACLLYCNQNRGYLPSSPSQALNYVDHLETFLDPRITSNRPAPDPANLDEAGKADWANKYSAFALAVTPGTRISKLGKVTTVPLWVSRVDETTGELLICFADGHIEVFAAKVTRPSARPVAKPMMPPSTQPHQ